MNSKLHAAAPCAQATWHAGAGVTLVVAVLALACSRADSQRAPASSARTTSTVPSVPMLTMAATGPYRVAAPVRGGRVTGSIAFDGPTPADSVVHPQVDADVCGQTVVDPTVSHRGPQLANAVVWLEGVAAGKAMPLVRRYDITNEGCVLVPRVQAAVAGGTLDVGNADQAVHRTRFIQSASRTVLATVVETEAGAVVPTRTALASPGLVEVRCDQHPWARAWILVFDQPYFTTSNANGVFSIDSVPPGRYRISVWHERFGTQSDSVTVVAGGDAVVDLTFKPKTLGD